MRLKSQRAFKLSGPDSGLPTEVDAEAWGGEIHIPSEGICAGDLFIMPNWRAFWPSGAQEDGSLTRAVGKRCHFLLTANDYAELLAAHRTVMGNWMLYESKRPYEPSNPLEPSGCRYEPMPMLPGNACSNCY
jgi:hypothetical protein